MFRSDRTLCDPGRAIRPIRLVLMYPMPVLSALRGRTSVLIRSGLRGTEAIRGTYDSRLGQHRSVGHLVDDVNAEIIALCMVTNVRICGRA